MRKKFTQFVHFASSVHEKSPKICILPGNEACICSTRDNLVRNNKFSSLEFCLRSIRYALNSSVRSHMGIALI